VNTQEVHIIASAVIMGARTMDGAILHLVLVSVILNTMECIVKSTMDMVHHALLGYVITEEIVARQLIVVFVLMVGLETSVTLLQVGGNVRARIVTVKIMGIVIIPQEIAFVHLVILECNVLHLKNKPVMQ